MTGIPRRPAWTTRSLYGTVYASEQAFDHANGVATAASEALKHLVLALASENRAEIKLARDNASNTLARITASGWRWQ